jgi:hypothetical protein
MQVLDSSKQIGGGQETRATGGNERTANETRFTCALESTREKYV